MSSLAPDRPALVDYPGIPESFTMVFYNRCSALLQWDRKEGVSVPAFQHARAAGNCSL